MQRQTVFPICKLTKSTTAKIAIDQSHELGLQSGSSLGVTGDPQPTSLPSLLLPCVLQQQGVELNKEPGLEPRHCNNWCGYSKQH